MQSEKTKTEDRVKEIEHKISYQEYLLEQLNEVVTKQQSQINALESEVKRIQESQKKTESSIYKDAIDEAPPPHY